MTSVKPSKQRKAVWAAPLHKRHKLMSAHLSLDLMEKYGRKSIPLRKGDTVRVLRGDYKGMEGKVTKVDLRRLKVTIDGVTREKADGTTRHIPLHPSNLMVTKLNLDDKWRRQRATSAKEVEEVEVTPEEETEEEAAEEESQGGGESG